MFSQSQVHYFSKTHENLVTYSQEHGNLCDQVGYVIWFISYGTAGHFGIGVYSQPLFSAVHY